MQHEIDELWTHMLELPANLAHSTLTSEGIRIRQGAGLVCLSEIVERCHEAEDQIFAELWREL